MQSLQARTDSFKKAKRVKRYPNKSSSTASIKWPHPSSFKANANTLAEAGFFFNPSWDDRDSVACFLCGKELSDWDASDDPFEIHYSKCQSSCAWAVVRCGLTEDLDDEGRFVFRNRSRLPSSKAMEKARLETFGKDWWPHDSEPGHGATSLRMAQAGFVYTPQTARDDTVTCLYCNLSLSGWEEQDDPDQEHRSRDSKSGIPCPFLESLRSTVSSKPQRKTKGTRGKSTKAPAPVVRRYPSPGESHPPEQEAFDPIPNHPNSIVSLSPAGHPTIADSESLTHDDRMMTLEQWIRQEINFSYDRLLTDGQKQIASFKAKATELRKCIDEL